MASPFPGMDPYLEQPTFWSEFHNRLIVAIADNLIPNLLPNYYIGVETRTYRDYGDGQLLIGIPDAVILSGNSPSSPQQDETTIPNATIATQIRPQEVTLPASVEVKQRYLEIREVGTEAVITILELLSPVNKRNGEGRTTYETKRQKILDSATHLVEIDLLRSHQPMTMAGATSTSDYRILISRSEQRPKADLYGFTLQTPIPTVPIPLKSISETITLNLQEILQGVYDRGAYSIRIDYQQPIPAPTLSPNNQAWIQQHLNPQ
jgi:hypothetical protein